MIRSLVWKSRDESRDFELIVDADAYIISVPDLSKTKEASKPSKLPATPTKGYKKGKKVVDASTPSPAKSTGSVYTTEEEGTPSKKKAFGW